MTDGVAPDTRRILFLPVSGPSGAGEYYRCATLATACRDASPDWEIHLGVNRHARVVEPEAIHRHLLEDTPTRDTAGVLKLLNDLRPDIVVFDSSLRQSQLKAAHNLGARIVYISSRPAKRRKGFSFRKLRKLNEHWMIAPPSLHRLSTMERLKLQLGNPTAPRFFSSLLPTPDTHARETWLQAHQFPTHRYALFVSGGGGGSIGESPTAEVFQTAARRFHQESGIPTLFIAGPLSETPLTTQGQRLEVREVPPSRLSDLIQGAELVVSGGGSIIQQALALEKPCLAIPAGGSDQPARIRQLSERGVISTCEPAATVLAQAAEKLWWDQDQRERMVRESINQGFTNGLNEAVAALHALAHGQATQQP